MYYVSNINLKNYILVTLSQILEFPHRWVPLLENTIREFRKVLGKSTLSWSVGPFSKFGIVYPIMPKRALDWA